jgi:hypothetical protein
MPSREDLLKTARRTWLKDYDPRQLPKSTLSFKAPKLRGKPGEFYRDKHDGRLYCVVFIYRLKKEPNIWRYTLEERKDLSTPDTLLSGMCEAIAGKIPDSERILWEPLNDTGMRMHPQDYCHGDRLTITSKKLINDFELLSSGEIT